MNQTLWKGALVGGVVAFVWSMISWMLLPWHNAAFTNFRDEDAVARVVSENIGGPGIYGIPGNPMKPGMTAEQRKAAEAAMMERMKSGPFVFMAVRPQGMSSMAMPMITQFLTMVVGCLLLTWLLLQSTARNHAARARFAVVAALTAGVMIHLPEWNWWGFSTMYTLVGIADLMVAGLLSGLAISRFAFPKAA